MHIQYVLGLVLLVGGSVTAWFGPEFGVREDSTPYPPNEHRRLRQFGAALMVCGAVVLVATLLGFRGQPLNDLPTP